MMRYIGAAAATGYPLEIPILIRSLAACMYTTPTADHVVLDMDFKVLQALDAGTVIGDPSALVEKYACAWWLKIAAPSEDGEVLDTATMHECLREHRQFTEHIAPKMTFEKPRYTWGRGLLSQGTNDVGCADCRPMRAIVTAACDELRELRQVVDSLESFFDMECELSNRRASGAYSLFTSAELKGMKEGEVAVDAETGIQQKIPSAPPQLVAGSVRRPKKGPEVVKQVSRAAKADLLDFKSRPNLKWTWGVDLDIKDLEDLMGSRYHGRLEQSHSGYDTDLPDGTVTGSHSDYPGPLPKRPVFDELSPDIMEPAELASEDIPHIFQHYPLRRTGAPGTALARMMEQKMANHGRRRGRKTGVLPVVPMPDMTSFTVPKPSAVVRPPVASSTKQSDDGYDHTRRASPTIRSQLGPSDSIPIGMDSQCTPSALRVRDIGDITVSPIGDQTPIDWVRHPVILDTIGRATPDISTRRVDIPSSPTTQWVQGGRRINIFSDDEMEVDALTDRSLADNETEVVHAENDAAIDADALANAWHSSPEESAPHSGIVVDANVLADAWSASDEEGPADVDVEALAAAWYSEGSVSPRQADTGEVATPSRQEVTMDVAQLAALWSVSSEESESESESASESASASPTSSSGESDNDNMALDSVPVSLYLSLADTSNTFFLGCIGKSCYSSGGRIWTVYCEIL